MFNILMHLTIKVVKAYLVSRVFKIGNADIKLQKFKAIYMKEIS